MPEVIVIAHNIRSTHNIGAIFRTCEGFGVRELILSGYSPYPEQPNDTRLPHIFKKMTEQIHKTALGAEVLLASSYSEEPPLAELKRNGYTVIGLEQDKKAFRLPEYSAPSKIALLLGEEVGGIELAYRQQCDALLEIPMIGQKESFNVSVATGIALYGLMIDT